MQSSLVTASRLSGGTFAKLSAGQRTNSDMPHATSGLTRGAGMGRKLNNPSWTSGTFPLPQATLDIDFTNNRSYVKGASNGGTGSAFDSLSFSRASNATYFGADGLLKTTGFPQPYQVTTNTPIPPNYGLNSQTFTGAGWTYSAVTPTDNVLLTTAPDGTSTAGKWVASVSGVVNHSLGQTIGLPISNLAGAQTVFFSIYVKAAEFNRIILGTNQGSRACYDVSTGTIIQQNSGVTATITPVGNGWYRCGYLFSNVSQSQTVGIFLCRNTDTVVTSFAGDGVSGIYVWGYQVENIANANYRFDYQAPYSDYPKNSYLESEDFGNATYWTPTFITPSTDGTLAPGGLTQASLLTVTADNQSHYIQTATNAFGSCPATFSIYAKAGTATKFRFMNNAAYGTYVDFDLSTQQGVLSGGYITNITVTPLTNGWYRCSFALLTGLNANATRIYILNSAGAITYAGAGQSMYFFGIQQEGILYGSFQSPPSPPNNFAIGQYGVKRNSLTFINSTLNLSTKAGFRAESSRTNYALWCRDLTQSSWTATSITPTLNQVGIDGVSNSASGLVATASNGTILQSITLASNFVAFSIFVKAITVTGNIQATINGGTTWFDIQGLSTSSWNRIAVIANPQITNPSIGIRIVNNGDSIAVDYAQLEINDSSDFTSPIFTTTSTATRAADFCSVPTNVWMNQYEGTISGRYYATFGTSGVSYTGRQICGTGYSTVTAGSNIIPMYSCVVGVNHVAINNTGINKVTSGNCIANTTNNFAYAYRFDGTVRIATNASLPVGNAIYKMSSQQYINELSSPYDFPLLYGGNGSWTYYNQPTFYIGCGSNGPPNGVIYRITYTPKFLSTEATAQLTSNENIL